MTPKASAVVTTPRVQAELVAQAPEGVAPGKPLWLGLRLTHQREWHTYWKNAGDSGLPTELQWHLPAGLTAGEPAWPAPRKIFIGHLANYGYEDTVLLPVPVTVGPDFVPPAGLTGATGVPIRLKASWLVCKQECIPEEGEFGLTLPAAGSTALHAAEFDAARAGQPQALADRGQVTVEGQALSIRLDGLPPGAQGKALEFFPETGEVVRNGAVAGRDWQQQWEGGRWQARFPLAEQRGASPTQLPLVVALASEADRAAARAAGQPVAWRAEPPVQGDWPSPVAARAEVSPALQAALAANAAAGSAGSGSPAPSASVGLLAALLGALIGGVLLNLMPCVFPVLAIKVMGFARQAGDTGGHRRAAMAYAAGVLLSFLALGGAMVALRAAGTQLGWGFQLQSPVVVASLAGLFTLIGLNLAGVFELRMLAPSSLCAAEARHPRVNDFLSGVLAVVIASPCTAPFMGVSLGAALTLPATEALLLFGVLGVGFALPYLAAGFVPALARALPRPGPWMETLRRLLAFPMFATVAWLVWVLGQQAGVDGAGALLALLVAGSAVVWACTLRGRTRVVLAGVLLLGFGSLLAVLGRQVVREAAAPTVAQGGNPQSGASWQPWSGERAATLLAQGQPVFVDFTAAWCVTCQYNKNTTLADAAVLADFRARGVALLRADWTRRDPAITAALAQLGRNGVPVYVLQAPGKPPRVLGELLGRDELHAALAAL